MKWLVILSVGIVGAALVAATAATAENEAVGRWDMTVMVSATSKPASWIEIHPEKDKFVGTFCGEAGGVHGVGEVKVDGNKVAFKSEESDTPEFTYKATIKNNILNGTRTSNKNKQDPLIGLKFIPPVNVTGDWQMKTGEGEKAEKMTLSLSQADQKISGKLAGKDGGEVAQATLKGEHLTLVVKHGDKTRKLEGRVKGDAMEGTMETDGKAEKFVAHRQRKWGEPIRLFNGKNLDGWHAVDPPGEKADNKWTVVDGVLTNTAGGKNLVSDRKFKDCKLHVEFRVPPKGNSGVYLRGRYEIQVHDSADKKPSTHSCGAVYSRIAPSVNAAKPAGEWQTFDVTLVGQYLAVVHNGQTIIDNQEIEGITGGALDSNEYEPGPIYFQGDHGKIEYRNVVVTPAL